MAIEVFPDSPTAGMSPRISFSHDLSQNEDVPGEHYLRSPSSASASAAASRDFDFCVFPESFEHDYSSSADELFSDGKILPIEIKRRLPPPPPRPPPRYIPPPPPPSQLQKTEEKQSKALSFWSFKRSTSLNCGNDYARTLCPLPLLSRSNSTGSTSSSSVKHSNSNPHNQKQNFSKSISLNTPFKQSSSSNHQKPPLKKNTHGSYSNGVKINPVLNIPPANLFGLGSIFSGGKDRSKKK